MKTHCATVSQTIDGLRRQGFVADFNREKNCPVCHTEKFNPEDFEIVDICRCETRKNLQEIKN